MKSLAALLTVAALASAGCFRTRFDLAPPQPQVPSPAYTDHYHLNLINIIELSAPVDLARACNGAPPVAIEEQVGPLAAIANMFLSYFIPILSLHNATVMCPAGGGMMMAPQPMPMGPQQPMPQGPMPQGPMPQQ